ncbi:rhodanese-like domain-containing protein [Pedobacter sp. SAFR-022]|uniref:rhodanese-like domain-containing protein n=1 Tax=Pedobacter sp. SAFR-022 TaxID=3436861 RepID=UPI003F7D13D6
MKNLKFLCINVLACMLFVVTANAQGLSLKKQVWPDKHLMQTKTLVDILQNPRAAKPNIYNIGFVGNIQGAKKLAAASKEEGLAQLKSELKDKPKTSPIVIYCGCCPFEHCPNVKPAFTMLQKLGYTNAKILNLPTSIKADWTDKGYPMAK